VILKVNGKVKVNDTAMSSGTVVKIGDSVKVVGGNQITSLSAVVTDVGEKKGLKQDLMISVKAAIAGEFYSTEGPTDTYSKVYPGVAVVAKLIFGRDARLEIRS
jgi:hypothetical protein